MADTLHFRFDESSGRIEGRYWGDEPPQRISNPKDGYAYGSDSAFSQAARETLFQSAQDSVEAGTDYDPETETAVAYLYYDEATGEIYSDVEIQPLPDTDTQ